MIEFILIVVVLLLLIGIFVQRGIQMITISEGDGGGFGRPFF